MEIRLNPEQTAALGAIRSFLSDDSLDAFILRGSAGTGKTTLVAKLVEELKRVHLSCALLAPTGRAARILGNKVRQILEDDQHDGSTIHREIYAMKNLEVNEDAETANDPGIRLIFPLKQEEASAYLFVIDESSMVGDQETHSDFMQFGSGRILKDLVTYVRMRRPGRERDHLTKLLFVGDPAQLPPVGEASSPALSDDYLKTHFGLSVRSFDLGTVMRQARGSAILDRATTLRDNLLAGRFNTFSFRPFHEDVHETNVQGALNLILKGMQDKETCLTVVHSNSLALEYNRNIRERLWGDPNTPVRVGDILLVNRNSSRHQLSNGDLVKVTAADEEAERYSINLLGGHQVDLVFRGVRVVYRTSDGSAIETGCFILENLLNSPYRELSPLEQRGLLVHFRKRYPALHPKSDEFRRTIIVDPYFNALQVKYGYAMTCHKAQGGEWEKVVVDFSGHSGASSASFFRWAYTAITRASKSLFVVNAPDFSAVSGIDWAPTAASAKARQLDEGSVSEDPDWDRFSFSPATAPLFQTHQQLRSVWDVQAITVEQLQHLQYCERYTLLRDGKRAMVQYHYDKKYRVKSAGAVPGSANDPTLTEEALTSLQALARTQGIAQPEEFIVEFLERMESSLQDSTLRVTGQKSMPYRVRIEFSDATRKGEIDFTYDGKHRWTAAQEVGGPGSSHGLYDEVQRLMQASVEKLQ